MKKVLIRTLLGGTLGYLLAEMGFSYTTWQFWAVLGIAAAMFVVELIED